MKKILVIGDVHGYFQQFESMISEYVEQVDLVIQVGDLIDRGPDSKAVLELAMKLDEQDKFIFLKGNHEFELLLHEQSGMNQHWYDKMGRATIKLLGADYPKYMECYGIEVDFEI